MEEAKADLVAAGEAVLKDPPSSASHEITDPGTEVSCLDGGRKMVTFSGNGTKEPSGADLDGFLDRTQDVFVEAIQTDRGFELTDSSRDQSDDLKRRDIVLLKKDGDIRLRIVIRPGGYEVIGDTGCLKSK